MSDSILSMNKQFTLCIDEDCNIKLDPKKFPFKTVLSLSPLTDFWNQDMSSSAHPVKAACAKQIQEELKKSPELLEPITDLSILEKHKDLVDMLMAVVFPPASWDSDFSAAVPPFSYDHFYSTPSYQRWVPSEDNIPTANLDAHTMEYVKVLYAYAYILKMFYDIELDFDYPIVRTGTDPETGLDRYFQVDINPRFCDIRKVSEPKPLTEADKKRLLDNLTDLKVLMELIPPEHFEFYGFVVVHALDVTDQEVISSIKHDLIERGSIVSQTRFNSLQDKLKTLFRRPNLALTIAALQGEQIFLLNSGVKKIQKNCIFSDSAHYSRCDFAGSVYEKAITQAEPLVIEDLTSYPNHTPVEGKMIKNGVRNVVVAPLYHQDELIGILDLQSPNPGDLNAMNAIKLWEVLPLFSVAIKRSMDEFDTNLQAIIKEKCTAIHPSVEWRFRKAALNYVEGLSAGIHPEMEPIVFHDVYPLYGVSDIRGSSTQRNAAIRADLAEHLTLAREIVRAASSYKPLPFLDELSYRIGKSIAEIESGLGSGDEMSIIEFLRREVEPFFDHLQEFGPGMGDKIQVYQEALDPELGTLYRRRKDFEESVTRINETLSTYLDEAEEKAQEMFPHYFEKHTTDGVDHSIYVGASLVEDGKFDLLYLRNLRLWQLMTMCEVARRARQLKASLEVPLETAHLIAVQNTPLAIRFRFDEKQFDVDGTYNIRYEIMKKRIDKAMIRGRAERLTQPGKIAIVYSQPKEAFEYREYIDYLQASGYLTDELEDVDLEDLQGIQGLKALRVTVDMKGVAQEPTVASEEVAEAVQSMAQVAT